MRQDQTRIATAVSEIARNALRYAGGGTVEFRRGQTPAAVFVIRVSDQGPGHRRPRRRPRRPLPLATGMGLGIVGARRLMDRFEIEVDAAAAAPPSAWARLPAAPRAAVTGATLAGSPTSWPRRAPPDPLDGDPRSRTRSCCGSSRSCASGQEELDAAQPRAGGHQPRRRRALCRARRAGRPPAPRRRDEVALPLQHEPRVPHAANSILALSRLLLDRMRRRADRRSRNGRSTSSARRRRT